MAKGNDGNYLQHSVEVALATLLAQITGILHVSLTHGMAPIEPCGSLPAGQTRRLLDEALIAAAGLQQAGEEPVVSAYRATKASREGYPNSGELIAAAVGRRNLTGGIAEVCEEKYAQLLAVWGNSDVRPVIGSWRSQTFLKEICTCPKPFGIPWLLSMDPMTYCANGYADDDRLYLQDQSRIVSALTSFVASGKPGIATIFVYAIRPEQRSRFWDFADAIAADVDMTFDPLWVTHQGGNRNLGAVLRANGAALPASWPPVGVRTGR